MENQQTKEEWREYVKYVYFAVITILGVGLYIYGYDFNEHLLWNSPEERLLGWCNNNKPLRNFSDHPNVAFCFGDGFKDYKTVWEERCKKEINEQCISDDLNPKYIEQELPYNNFTFEIQ